MGATLARYVPNPKAMGLLARMIDDDLLWPLAKRIANLSNRDAPGSLAGTAIPVVTTHQGYVFTNRREWIYVELGTRAHPIEPDQARVLRWEEPDGEVRYAMSVWHPGTDPNPVMRRALYRGLAEMLV